MRQQTICRKLVGLKTRARKKHFFIRLKSKAWEALILHPELTRIDYAVAIALHKSNYNSIFIALFLLYRERHCYQPAISFVYMNLSPPFPMLSSSLRLLLTLLLYLDILYIPTAKYGNNINVYSICYLKISQTSITALFTGSLFFFVFSSPLFLPPRSV